MTSDGDKGKRRQGWLERVLFDPQLGVEGKERGMAEARENPSRKELLALARQHAIRIACAHPGRLCTADDVQRAIIRDGYSPEDLGPAAGSLFRGSDWEFTGGWINSERVSNHSASIRVWRYIGKEVMPMSG